MPEDVFGRVPFGSIISACLICLGVGLFCGTLYTALEITLVGIFEELFYFRVEWLETIQIVFIILAIVMGCLSILFLVFGILATGATRRNIYSGAKCIMGGRISALFFLILTYVCNLLWVGMSSAVAMPIIIFAMFWSVCVHEFEGREESFYDYNCLNLSRFGIYRNYTENVDKNALCGETDIDTFCRHVKQAEPFFISSFVGSLLIVLGLAGFLMVLTVNVHKIGTSKELTEYRNAVDIEVESSFVVQNQSALSAPNTLSTRTGYSKY